MSSARNNFFTTTSSHGPTYASFTRALSPGLRANSAAGASTSQGQRLHASAYATSVAELSELVPLSYRDLVRESLDVLYQTAVKRSNAIAALNQLRKHKNDGTVPPQVAGLHLPVWPGGKEFVDSQAYKTSVSTLKSSHQEWCVAALQAGIDLKDAEVTFYQNALRTDSFWPALDAKATELYNSLAEKYVIPAAEPDQNGRLNFVENNALKTEFNNFKLDFVHLCQRAIDLERVKVVAEQKKLTKKINLKEAADVDMKDAQADSMRDAIRAELKSLGLATPAVSELSSEILEAVIIHSRRFTDMESPIPEGSKRRRIETQGSSGGTSSQSPYPPPTSGRFTRTTVRSTEYASVGQEGSSRATRQSLQRQGQGAGRQRPSRWEEAEGEREGRRTEVWRWKAKEVVADASWRYGAPSTYPDIILTLPFEIATACLYSRVPPQVRAMAKFRAGVHVQPGMDVPPAVQIHASAGLKFLLYNRIDKELPLQAYRVFANTVRWKYAFTIKSEEAIASGRKLVESRYNPDYDKGDQLSSEAPESSRIIEDGLSQGQALLKRQLDAIPPSAIYKDHALVDVKRLEEWLVGNNAIILPTDKNLGSAIVTHDWYIEKCRELVGDTSSYKRISKDEAGAILVRTGRLAKQLSDNLAIAGPRNRQLREWLVSQIEEDEMYKHVPRFYGIPKIHKKPWKMRPIVPCHSTFQGPAAKVLSNMLKPVIELQPYIIKGSKDLVQKLAKVRLPSNAKVWIVSGDVTAFYPNVDRQMACKIAELEILRYYDKLNKEDELFFLRELIDLANNRLIMRFQDEFYVQTRGLAMGVACSPDMANLFGAQFETPIVAALHNLGQMLFYGRYIDDVIGLVLAQTEEEALKIAQMIRFPGCEIVWTASEDFTVFLDMVVYIDRESHLVHHRPYAKAQNHLERIPWASFHPLDVKRGTFIGEISRLATLSSLKRHYEDALHLLSKIYEARGYPSHVIKSWLLKYADARWRSRLETKVEREDHVHVLKTVFNPVWGHVRVSDISDVLRDKWSEEIVARERSRKTGQTRITDYAGYRRQHGGVRKRKHRLEVTASGVVPLSENSDASEDELDNGADTLADYLRQRLIVSRKGKLHLGKLVSSWRQTVLGFNERIEPTEMILEAWLVDGRRVQNPTQQPNPTTQPNLTHGQGEGSLRATKEVTWIDLEDD